MEILKIRESFSPGYHHTTSIPNFELIWNNVLLKKLEESNEIAIKCAKINEDLNCVFIKKDKDDKAHLETNYIVGLDYLSEDLSVMVIPKFDCCGNEYSIDFYKMLFDSLPWVNDNEDISNIYHIDFAKPKITIKQKDDLLTPILLIEFVNYLHNICRKGLKKSYYWVNENLTNKVKGKILIKETLKNNHLKSKYNKTFCQFQEFGINTKENQYLKYAFQFTISYLNQFESLKLIDHFKTKFGFIKSTLEQVTLNDNFRKEMKVKKDPLFPEYQNAIELANLILKRSSFNITNTTSNTVETYPYWIDMSKVFELHVLHLLRKAFRTGISYQKNVAGRIPDLIINNDSAKAIVDMKYKDYSKNSIDIIDDIRQVAAYARMKEILIEMGLGRNDVVDSIIIYPDINSNNNILSSEILNTKAELKDYFSIFKLHVNIPIIKKS